MNEVLNLNGKYLLASMPFFQGTITDINEYLKSASFINATVPGDINNDLVVADLKPYPYYGYNTKEFLDVPTLDWFYVKEFEYTKPKTEVINLVLEGVDTYADVYLNGVLLGSPSNMFLKYKYNIQDILNIGTNKLVVRIKSMANIIKQHNLLNHTGLFNSQRILTRKAQCHFGWDWAPVFWGLGIYKDVYIESSHWVSIDYVQIKTDLDGSVKAFLEFNRNDSSGDLQFDSADQLPPCEFTISEANRKVVDVTLTVSNEDTTVSQTIQTMCCKDFINLKVNNPKLWWCHGIGEANMYNYTVTVSYEGEILDIKQGKFAFRSVELVEDLIGPNQMGMQIKLNGVPVMVKGANWVPIDAMTGTISNSKYARQIDNALDANFSAFRVWGGGIYESDFFYDYCDSHGIMILQDFMLACSDIVEENREFTTNFIKEAEYQIRRLRNHPCIVMWFGNNEQVHCRYPYYANGMNFLQYLLGGMVHQLDGTRPYKYTSPTTYKDFSNDGSSLDHHGSIFGRPLMDDFKSFRHTCQDFPYAFETEMAIQGCGDLRSIKKYIPKSNLWPIDDLWEFHFRGNPYDPTNKTYLDNMEDKIQDLFGGHSGLNDYVKKSQALQYIYTEEIINASKAKLGQCNAMVFWMYSDIWTTGTWAISDFFNQPKSSAYACKKAFKPFGVIITPSNKGYKVTVCNETTKSKCGSIEFGITKLNGSKVWTKTKPYYCQGYSVDIIEEDIQIPKDCFLYAVIDKDYSTLTSFLGADYKDYVCDSKLVYTIKDVKQVDDCYITTIEIKCTDYAKMIFVNVNQDIEYMTDNYFDMLPNSTKVIEVKTKKLIENLEVNHISQNWN